MAWIELGIIMASKEELIEKALERKKKRTKVDDSSSTFSDVARAAGQGLTFGLGMSLPHLLYLLGIKLMKKLLLKKERLFQGLEKSLLCLHIRLR